MVFVCILGVIDYGVGCCSYIMGESMDDVWMDIGYFGCQFWCVFFVEFGVQYVEYGMYFDVFVVDQCYFEGVGQCWFDVVQFEVVVIFVVIFVIWCNDWCLFCFVLNVQCIVGVVFDYVVGVQEMVVVFVYQEGYVGLFEDVVFFDQVFGNYYLCGSQFQCGVGFWCDVDLQVGMYC